MSPPPIGHGSQPEHGPPVPSLSALDGAQGSGPHSTADSASVEPTERRAGLGASRVSVPPSDDVMPPSFSHQRPWGHERVRSRPRERVRGEGEWPRHKRHRSHRGGRPDHAYYDYDRAGLDRMQPKRSDMNLDTQPMPEELYGKPESAWTKSPSKQEGTAEADERVSTRPPPVQHEQEGAAVASPPSVPATVLPSLPVKAETAGPEDTSVHQETVKQDVLANIPVLPAQPVVAMIELDSMTSMEVEAKLPTSDGPVTEHTEAAPEPRSTAKAESVPIAAPEDSDVIDASMMTDMSIATAAESEVDPDMTAEVDVEADEKQAAIQSMATQLVARFPLTPMDMHTLTSASQCVAASVSTPVCLTTTKSRSEDDKASVPLDTMQAYLQTRLKDDADARAAKMAALRDEYREKNRAWLKNCAKLDRIYERRELQRRASQGLGDDTSPMTSSASALSVTPMPTSRSFRRGGFGSSGFGDAVRSEAEFQEILASLENAEMQDPAARAARTAAAVPDMELQGRPVYDDDQGYVADPVSFYFTDFDPDVWSEEEKAIFTKRYLQYPKQFGRIAEKLPHKSVQQCVAFYYLHKHEEGYKAMLTARHRERRKKGGKTRSKKARGNALMADIEATSTTVTAKATSTTTPPIPSPPTAPLDSAAMTEEEEKPTTPNARRPKPAASTKPPQSSQVATPTPTALPESKTDNILSASIMSTEALRTMATSDPALERDLAAAEALEALASLAMPMRTETKKRKPKARDGEEPKSRSRGPHWSMTERADFLRLLAIYGKDWHALSASFPAKTPAQTRNFFARHASENSHFQEAAALAQANANRPWADKVEAAHAFVRAWYDTLPPGANKDSITNWPCPGTQTPPPPPPNPVPPTPAVPIPTPMPATVTTSETIRRPTAPPHDDDEETDDEERSTGPSPSDSAPWTATRPSAYPPTYVPRAPPPMPMYYHRDAPSPYAPAVPPMGIYGYALPKYGAPASRPPPPGPMHGASPGGPGDGRYTPEMYRTSTSPMPRAPIRPTPNMGYFPPRPDRWH